MKSSLIPRLLALLLIVSVAEPCFGQKKAKDDATTIEQIKAGVAEAKAKDKRLIITLKNGSSVSGIVVATSDKGLSLMHTHEPFGPGATESINYSDVVSIKSRNPLVKALKNIGNVPVVVVGGAVLVILSVVSLLTGYPKLPSC